MKRLVGRKEFHIYLYTDLVVLAQVIAFLIAFLYAKAVDSGILQRSIYDIYIFGYARFIGMLVLDLALLVLIPIALRASHINRDHSERPQGHKRFFITFSMVILIPVWFLKAFYFVLKVFVFLGGGPG